MTRGHLQRSQQTFEDFFAAIVHARRTGKHNPVGMFVRIVLDGLWRHLTIEDERGGKRLWQQAIERMNELAPGEPLSPRAS